MERLLVFQWPAGLALMIYGILTWASHIESVVGQQLSAWTERTAGTTCGTFAIGLLSGSTLHGRHGFQYCRRRWLAGLLPKRTLILFPPGMAVGIFIPSALILLLPDAGAFLLLIAGMSTQLASRNPKTRETGHAILGMGCCWLGYNACRQAMLPDLAVPLAASATLVLTAITLTPAAALLALATIIPGSAGQLPTLTPIALLLATIWLALLVRTLRGANTPFNPVLSILSPYDLPFPERALQAVIQENRRMAFGLASAAQGMNPACDKQSGQTHPLQRVQDVESALDECKPATQRYLTQLSRYDLHKRQASLILYLFNNVGDLERISDHLLAVALALPDRKQRSTYPGSIIQGLDGLLASTADVLDLLAQSITANRERKAATTGKLDKARERARQMSEHFSAVLHDLIQNKVLSPAQAISMQDLRSHFERLVRHVRAITVTAENEDFWIEPDLIHERGRIAHRAPPADKLTRQQIQARLAAPREGAS